MNCEYIEKLTPMSKFYVANEIKFDGLTVKEFGLKMSPFIQLVDFWSRALGMLIAKCTNWKVRKNVVANLSDENCQEFTHVETYYLFLAECSNFIDERYFSSDADQKEQKRQKLYDDINGLLEITAKNQVIEKYISMLVVYIESNTFDDACQILGGIEYVYHLISEDINYFFDKERGKIPKFHYEAHEVLDTQHAIDLLECSTAPINQENLLKGAEWIVGVIKELLEN